MVRLSLIALVLAMVLAASLVGCALPPGNDEPAVTDPVDPGAPAEDIVTPAVPPDVEPDRDRAALGEPAAAGPWTLVVREVEYGDAFGGLRASEGTLARLEIDLANRSDADLAIAPSDFTLSVRGVSLLPLLGDDALVPERLVAAGTSERTTAVYEIDVDPEEIPLTLIFQPAEGDPVLIEVEIGE